VRLGAIGRELGDDSRDLLRAFPLDFDVLQATASTARQCMGSVRYGIRIGVVLDERWSAWFDGLGVESDGGETMLSGALPDQSALYGLLDKLRDLGLPLISVRCLLLEEQEAKER
jgi:hypothetical protein